MGELGEERRVADLDVGRKVTYFELPDQLDYPWSLSGQLELGPVMLIFYRGDWDPYCNGQLASYARQIEELEGRGVQLAGISVDPPSHNARMVGKLQLPFPLLSDPEGELARLFGLWDAEGGVALPSVVVVDQSAEVRYLFRGTDFADRPSDDEVFSGLQGLESRIERLTGGPEFQVGAAEARERTVRPDEPVMELDQLATYYQGVQLTTTLFKDRFGVWGRSGRRAFNEIDAFQQMVRHYMKAIDDTIEIGRSGA
jgi:peroxiredoxin